MVLLVIESRGPMPVTQESALSPSHAHPVSVLFFFQEVFRILLFQWILCKPSRKELTLLT